MRARQTINGRGRQSFVMKANTHTRQSLAVSINTHTRQSLAATLAAASAFTVAATLERLSGAESGSSALPPTHTPMRSTGDESNELERPCFTATPGARPGLR